ncbi:uncharacterized protein LOC128550887 isoform X2 [Mercenaria mercenaria]|nr:uncharacterized protein LOC128550887 isoform X2 [Mercenaria mercenaria]XP_053386827.1 uncharacterized protein LOC128550887 isoform X2 [Mercenaria mercenaria]
MFHKSMVLREQSYSKSTIYIMGSGKSRQVGCYSSGRRNSSNQDDCVIGGENTKEGIIQKQHTVQENIPKPTAYIMNPGHLLVSQQFVRAFREEMKIHGIVLTVIQDCNDIKLDTGVFLILVSTLYFRFEANVDECLSVISRKPYDKKILVILHFDTKEHKQCPEEYASIFRIIDMAFSIDDGIYPCEMNTNAHRQLEKIFNSHKKTIAMKTKSEGNGPDNDNTETRSNQQLKDSHADVIPETKIRTKEKDDSTKIVDRETNLLIDYINFHEFKGIFL